MNNYEYIENMMTNRIAEVITEIKYEQERIDDKRQNIIKFELELEDLKNAIKELEGLKTP